MASASASMWEEVYSTFLASVRSVGTACTLAGVGIYLHQRGFVVGNGKRTLALISQQVTIPLLFFTKILYCNQDWSAKPCPNVTDSLRDVWVLLIWPLYVCAAGILIGWGCARLAGVPSRQISGLLAAVGFGNSTGLPITLLSVIHSEFPADSGLGRIDPTLFLSVYLLLYPVLQWGIGGWLLAPPENNNESGKSERSNDDHKKDDSDNLPNSTSALTQSNGSTDSKGHHKPTLLAHNVLNRTDQMPERYQIQHRGLSSVDASFYMSIQENLNRWGRPVMGRVGSYAMSPQTGQSMMAAAVAAANQGNNNESKDDSDDEEMAMENGSNEGSVGMDLSGMDLSGRDLLPDVVEKSPINGALKRISEGGSEANGNATESDRSGNEQIFRTMKEQNGGGGGDIEEINESPTNETSALLPSSGGKSVEKEKNVVIVTPNSTESDDDKSVEQEEHLCVTCGKVIRRCLQPPVIGALSGLLIASMPRLRGIFVDIYDRNGDAPLQWFFDGLYTAGLAAVPINMMILGCNLSASYMLDANAVEHRSKFFSTKATLYVVVGKMIIMPLVGYISTYLLSRVYHVAEEIAGSFYLVLLIVFLCPTANNVMVMVELSGSGSKEGMARIIAIQYMIAPIVLSLTVTIAVFMASSL